MNNCFKLINLTDYTTYKKKNKNKNNEVTQFEELQEYKDKIGESSRTVQSNFNLGLTRTIADNGDDIWETKKYCGYSWLKDLNGNTIKESGETEKPIVLHIDPRFKNLGTISDMIGVIAADDEFADYLSMDLSEEKRLILYSFEDDLIDSNDQVNDSRLLSAISYIFLLQESTRRALISKTIKNSENLTGKVKGKINIKKQISQNMCRGRADKIYCQYHEKSIDILENQILKYALIQAGEYLNQYMKVIPNDIRQAIQICKRRFITVSDKKILPIDVDKIKLPNIYQSYTSVFQIAKVIITEISMTPTGTNESKGLVPYSINMSQLFECYVRTRVKKAIETFNNKKDGIYRIKMLKYVPDPMNPKGTEKEYGYKKLFPNKELYLKANFVPDIVLAYYKKDNEEQKSRNNPLFYRVFDVKYRNVFYANDNAKSRDEERYKTDRTDRLQLLAYDFIFNSNSFTGHFFPMQGTNTTKDKKKYVVQETLIDVLGGERKYLGIFVGQGELDGFEGWLDVDE